MITPIPKALVVVGLAFILCSIAQAQSFLAWKGLKPGSRPVGYREVVTADNARTLGAPYDYFGRARPGFGSRPLLIALWYPARSANEGATMRWEDYLTGLAWVGAEDAAKTAAEELRFIQTVTPNASPMVPATFAAFRSERVHARRGAAPAAQRCPVIIYAAGGGYPATDNSVLCEYLASHGYIVIATPPIGADSRELGDTVDDFEAGARDLEFLVGYALSLPQADPERMAAIGFSWGGIPSGMLALRNPRIKALVSLDGTLRDRRSLPLLKAIAGFDARRLRVPVLSLTPEPATRLMDDNSFFEAAAHAELTAVTFPHLEHHDFASFSALLRRAAEPGRGRDWRLANASYESACRIVLGFLNTHLRAEKAPLVEPEKLARITVRPAKKAPPTPRDFRELLAAEGPKRAMELVRLAQREFPDTLASFEGALNLAGYNLIGRGEYAAAIDLLKSSAAHFPTSINAYDLLGEAHVSLKEWNDAERCYLTARQLNEKRDVPEERKAFYRKHVEESLAKIRAGRGH